jgi:tetratricopeptide (TPR) repeat protein
MDEATSIYEDWQPPGDGGGKPISPAGFDLAEEIGRGGMGVVFRATDRSLGREVAVKILQQRFAADSPTARRFVDEARVTAQLQHPGVPAVYQVGSLEDGRPFLAMKLIKGNTLDELIKDGVPFDALAVIAAIAHTVGYAHARGVIHRDLKPANVMVGAFGEVQVMDWGLSKVLSPADEAAPASSDSEETVSHTAIRPLREADGDATEAGRILGTPAYMAPEQAAGDSGKVDARSDVFGLGAILCAMLTGKPAFEGDDAESVWRNAMRGRTEDAFERLDRCGADPGVVALCKRCLAFEPAERPNHADEVALAVASLRRAADERASQAERERLAAEVRANEQVKRRRTVQQWAVASAAVLLFGVIGTSAGLYWADRERRTALAKEQEANRIVEFFQKKVLAAPRPKGTQGGLGKDVSLRDAIVAALPDLDREFQDQPLVEAKLRLSLGTTFWQLGHYGDAHAQHERCHAILKERLGAEHPETLNAESHVANELIKLGKAEEGVARHRRILEARTRVLGAGREDTFKSMEHVAFGLVELGRFAEALPLQQNALEGRRLIHGPEHEDTLASVNNLAVILSSMKRPEEALRLREEWKSAFELAHPAGHADLLAFQSNLARSYIDAKRFDEGLKLHQEVLTTRSRLLGRDHPDTLHSLGDVAQALWFLGRGAEAVPLIDECVSHSKKASPALLSTVMAVRLRHFQAIGDGLGCRKCAEMHESLAAGDADHWVDSACHRAVAAAAFAKSNKQSESAAEADRAMILLQRAVAGGFKNAAHLKKDRDLDALRDRDDYKKLIASMERKGT